MTNASQQIIVDTKNSPNNVISNKNLFANIRKRFSLLPGVNGLKNISKVLEEGTQRIGSGSALDEVRREAEVIADDVILSFGQEQKKRPPNKFCKTMRNTVKELTSRHDIAFRGMVNKLNIDSANLFQTFVTVADEIFDDGKINWGRIVAVYAFACRLSVREEKPNLSKKIALFVGKYVANKLGKWILDNGGWVNNSYLYIDTTKCIKICFICSVEH